MRDIRLYKIKLYQRVVAILISLATFIISLYIVENIVEAHPNMQVIVVMILLLPGLIITGFIYRYILDYFEKRNQKNG